MEDKTARRERFQYWLDEQFSRGTATLILWLGVLSLAVIVIAGFLISVFQIKPGGGEQLSFFEAAWQSLMRTLDAGTMGGDEGWGFRAAMFLVTLGGVFIISTLIGVLTSGVESKLDALRKGRSRVLESGHTVILGWNEQIYTLINELIEANSNQAKGCIVVLGDHDKVEMEEEIAQKIEDTRNTKIVCRSGEPMDMADLNIVNLNTAKSIIVLAPKSEDPDAEVIKTVLAIVNHPKRHQAPYHIVAEIYDRKNMEAALVAGKNEVEWILVGDFVSRVIAQTCRQSGLSMVYTELLDFGGDEIYIHEEPTLAGKKFGEVLAAYETNAVMGICQTGEMPRLNPPMDTILRSGDQLVLIAEDDDKIFLTQERGRVIQEAAIVAEGKSQPAPEKTLILGWNQRGSSIIQELDHYVPAGSQVLVVADVENLAAIIENGCADVANQQITHRIGDTTNRRLLDGLGLSEFHHIIVLCYSDNLSMQQADARTIVTLLHLRDIADKSGSKFTIVSEMIDLRNRSLADVTRADDFIVSDKLVSLMMAQVSENKQLNGVFQDLFDPEGSEVYLKPITDYVQPGMTVNFYTVVEAARRRSEVAIGYRLTRLANDAEQGYGVKVNPSKTEEIVFAPEDKIVVIAED